MEKLNIIGEAIAGKLDRKPKKKKPDKKKYHYRSGDSGYTSDGKPKPYRKDGK